MSYREVELEAKGYRLSRCHLENKEEAKEIAKWYRGEGYNATVLETSRRGVPYYEVWTRKAD
jgi:hypothetical protein